MCCRRICGDSRKKRTPCARLAPVTEHRSLSRRSFLAIAGMAPFAASANAFFKPVPVGLELYSVRTELAKNLLGTVASVAKIGYQVVEFYAPYLDWTPPTAKDVRKVLDDAGIRC